MENYNNPMAPRNPVAWTRKQVLDTIQTTYGHTPQWPHVRSRILKIFGRDGLESMLSSPCSHETASADNVRPFKAHQ